MESTRKPLNEDRVALLLGAVIFILAMLKFGNMDILGWAVKTGMWVGDPLTAWSSATKGYLSGVSALIATYVFLAAILAVGVKLMGANVKKFLTSFTIFSSSPSPATRWVRTPTSRPTKPSGPNSALPGAWASALKPASSSR